MAEALNGDLEDYCSSSPQSSAAPSRKRLYGFGLLPIAPGVSPASVVKIVEQIGKLPHLKGVILGTRGFGSGLDDQSLDEVWGALERHGLVIFLHPHYGVGSGEWGTKDNGHVLPLALGFPMETTIAITRLILAGVLDRHPNLKILLAHSGGVLPQLSSRLASCIHHDPAVAKRLKHDVRYYMGKLWYDAVAYGSEELEFVSKTVDRAKRFGVEDGNGPSHMLFGTDYPFFPPDGNLDDKWKSVLDNLDAINGVQGWSDQEKEGVRCSNAIRLFAL